MLSPQGPLHALVAVVATPDSLAVLEGEEQRVQAKWPGSPVLLAGLKLTKAERFDSLDAVAARIKNEVLDCRTPLGSARRVTLLVDASHYTAGPLAARCFWGLKLGGRVQLGLVEILPADIPRPERRGWRFVIGRRTVASAMAEMIDSGRIIVSVDSTKAQEIRSQLEAFKERPVKASEEDPLEGEDFARGLGLLAWYQSAQPARGAVAPRFAA
jgi:hypothetical protein